MARACRLPPGFGEYAVALYEKLSVEPAIRSGERGRGFVLTVPYRDERSHTYGYRIVQRGGTLSVTRLGKTEMGCLLSVTERKQVAQILGGAARACRRLRRRGRGPHDLVVVT